MLINLHNVDSRASLWAYFSAALKVGFGGYENWGQFEEAILTQLEDNPHEPLYILHSGIFSVAKLDCQKYMRVIKAAAEEHRIYVCFDPRAFKGENLLRELSADVPY